MVSFEPRWRTGAKTPGVVFNVQDYKFVLHCTVCPPSEGYVVSSELIFGTAIGPSRESKQLMSQGCIAQQVINHEVLISVMHNSKKKGERFLAQYHGLHGLSKEHAQS